MIKAAIYSFTKILTYTCVLVAWRDEQDWKI